MKRRAARHKRLAMWSALPPYFGGKRKLVGAIFKAIPPPAEDPVLIDPFVGGGSVALMAKARGHRVICADIAERSAIVGKALIENSHVKLAEDDLTYLMQPNGSPGFAETHLAPETFPLPHARFMDAAVANARQLEGPKKWLSLLLVLKVAMRVRPAGNFGARTIMQQLHNCDWEHVNPNYVRTLAAGAAVQHPKRVAETARREINRGVFSNGQPNEAYQEDVFTFLPRVQGDVVYWDPPYASTQSYERALRPLDMLLRGEEVAVEPNPFSTEAPARILPRLFECADHIPVWVMSYGNKAITLSDLAALMKRFRPKVEAQAIKYVHCTGLAGAESRAKNEEYLLVGRR